MSTMEECSWASVATPVNRPSSYSLPTQLIQCFLAKTFNGMGVTTTPLKAEGLTDIVLLKRKRGIHSIHFRHCWSQKELGRYGDHS